jgi:hypothetical protein
MRRRQGWGTARCGLIGAVLIGAVLVGCSSGPDVTITQPLTAEVTDSPGEENQSGNGMGDGAVPPGGEEPGAESSESSGSDEVPSRDVPVVTREEPGSAMGSDSDTPAVVTGDVAFSVPSGTFEGSLSVTLSPPILGAEIRYTLDGSVPELNSPLYSGAIELAETRQVRAQAFVAGVPVGAAGAGLYVARTFDATSDLPLIVVDGYGLGKPQDQDTFADMALLVFEASAGEARISQPPALATRGGWHLRGNSSAYFEQAPYRIELWDNASEDTDQPLLGMPAASDWALIGPYEDRSLIRNAFVYGLGRDLGLSAPRLAFAEVYINYADRPLSSTDYQGVYQVVETIENSPGRLDLAQLDSGDTRPDELSGGYIFKFDWRASEEPIVACTGSEPIAETFGEGADAGEGGSCWTDLEVVDPEPLAPEQAAWLGDYVGRFNTALHEGTFDEYSSFIDVDSFVDLFIVNELVRNLDSYSRSAYYHKDRDQPLRAGPLWDYDAALGLGFPENMDVAGWQFRQRQVSNDWFQILGVDPSFLARVSARWRELRESLLSDAELELRIDALIQPLAAAAERDNERWPVPSVASLSIFQIPDEPSWAGQVQFIRDWLRERAAWLDSQL